MTETPRRGATPAKRLSRLFLVLILLVALLPTTASAEDGLATWYGPGFHGNVMANGQIYDMYDPTTSAANRWPFGTWLRVTNPANGRSVEVQVRDRGGFTHALDLSYAAFAKLADPVVMWLRIHYEVIPGPGAVRAAPSLTPTPRATPRPTESPTPDTGASRHTVSSGDTLRAIAARYATSVGALADANGIADPNLIRVGQVILIPRAGAPAPPATAPSTPTPPPAPTATPVPAATATPGTHRVAPGETLWRIAQRYGVALEALVRANQIADPDLLRPGQELTIPG